MNKILENYGLDQPWILVLLTLALIPLLIRGHSAFTYPSTARLPYDSLSIWLERLWRILGALAIVFVVLGLTGIYLNNPTIERIGRGAHIMIVLDRSASMNDDFADKPGSVSTSKIAVARKVLQTFVSKSREDLIGMVTFGTSPILAAPLSSDIKAVNAALDATKGGGTGFTAVARGLGMALDYYEAKPITGSRVILMVSDGGAHLEQKTQDLLRVMFQKQGASLYWIFLRSKNGSSITEPEDKDHPEAYPEYQLHQFFGTLGVPYQAYEAENPDDVARAMSDVSRLKNQPVRYQTAAPRRSMSNIFYLLALLCTCGLFALHLTEVKQWRSA